MISQTVEDAAAAAYEVIHASVCVVQVGVELQGLVYGNGRICILERGQVDQTFVHSTTQTLGPLGGGRVHLRCGGMRNWAVTYVGREGSTQELLPLPLLGLSGVAPMLKILQSAAKVLDVVL